MILLTNNCEEVAARIAGHYGEMEEALQLQEECAELIQAISKHRRYRDSVTKYHLCEEMADVLATMDRLIYLMGINTAGLREIIRQKNQRELERIEKRDQKKICSIG